MCGSRLMSEMADRCRPSISLPMGSGPTLLRHDRHQFLIYDAPHDLRRERIGQFLSGKPAFAEIVTPAATLAIGAVETVALWKEGSAEPGANRTAYIEFQVRTSTPLTSASKIRSSLCTN